jgi:flagellin
MRINNNITAINSHRQYGINAGNISRNMERLSSGFRVNRAADDAAGLAISEKMRSQIRGLNQASRNSQDAISLVQTAEGGMQTIQDVLQRMRELAVQSSSDTNTSEDRGALEAEFEALRLEIRDISTRTEFNTMVLLNDAQPSITVQSGANGGQTTVMNIPDLNPDALGTSGLTSASTIENAAGARAAITSLDNALKSVSMARANIGAVQNRLEFKIQNLNNQAENIAAAESRIRDADMAATMTEFTKNNILFQASTAMLAQANSQPQSVLQLLG